MKSILVALTAIVLLGALVAVSGCGGGSATTVTETVTAEESESGSPEEPIEEEAPESGSAPKVQTFHGTGQKSLGTIEVPEYATVSWICASCGNTNFIIENSESDEGYFPVNGLEETHGVSPLEAGTYHTVVVETSAGPWTVTIEGE